MQTMTIRARLSIGLLIVLAVMLGALIKIAMGAFGQLAEQAQQRELQRLHATFEAQVASESRLAAALASTIAEQPAIAAARGRGDRATLLTELGPVFEAMQQRYGVRQFQFHQPPARSFLRLHRPEKYGDDLSTFRFTVIEANDSQQPVLGLESGVAGLGVRGVVPVFDRGNHVGSVEFGMSLGQEFLDSFKALHSADAVVHLIDGNGELSRYAGTTERPLLSITELGNALAGDTLIQQHDSGRQTLAVNGRPIRDFSGVAIGVIEIASDTSFYGDALRRASRTMLFAGLLIGTLALVFMLWAGRTIVSPIQHTAAALQDIAKGDADLTRRLSENSSRELAELAAAFNQFVARLQQIMLPVREGAKLMRRSANDMVASNVDMSSRTEQQSSNLEETAATVDILSMEMQASANDTKSINALMQSARQDVDSGTQLLQQVASAMSEIEAGSAKIAEITSVVDDLAFQTNLIALNAAVEAARAGEHGRGFAVVANEVRSLANRSKGSAQEIKRIVEDSAVKIQDCSRQTLESDAVLSRTRETFDEVAATMAQVTGVISGQAQSVEEINKAVSQLETMTQQNASMVEESAAVGEELQRKSDELEALVSQFKLNG